MKINKKTLTKQNLINIINEYEERIKSLEDMIVGINSGEFVCNNGCNWIDNTNSSDPHMICSKCFRKEPYNPPHTFTTS